MSHPCRPHGVIASPRMQPRATGPIPWPTFTGIAKEFGVTPDGRVAVFTKEKAAKHTLQNAADLLADAPRIVSANDILFGTKSGPVNVLVFNLGGSVHGLGGADHMSCDYKTGQNIEVDADWGDSAFVGALFEAELSECSMNGRLCGLSTGEGLSRWCAMATSNNAILPQFLSAPVWAKAGFPNWVDRIAPTDQDYNSTGCTMAFLSWIQSAQRLLSSSQPNFGFPLSSAAQTMVRLGDSGTLAMLYAAMTGDVATNAWPKFIAAVKALPAPGVVNDDPFGAFKPVIA